MVGWTAVCVVAALLVADVSPAQDRAPVPEQLLVAKSVYLINDSGDLKAYDKFYSELKKWGRLQIVTSRDAADVVAVLTSSSTYALSASTATAATADNVTTATGTSVSVPSTFLHLKVFDRSSGEPLWSDSTEKWVTAGHAPTKLVSNLKSRMPKTK